MEIPKDLNDRTEYPDMVHWFSPSVLLKTVQKVITSTIFAEYADRRLVHAALDSPLDPEALWQRCGGATGIAGTKTDMWVDYVADLGDGFESTYAIAYLLAQRSLPLRGGLPRSDCLIMGGDEVYPDASRDDYEKRLKRPYRYAFPSHPAGDHPKVYFIPGNHDWYDGLTLFLANFCRGRDTSFGSWNATQSRSYFAVHIGHDWWFWGYDSQLEEDIDKPQADYFATVARMMKPGSKVILCASVPTWLSAEMKEKDPAKRLKFYRGLHYIANIARRECTGAKVPLVLSGTFITTAATSQKTPVRHSLRQAVAELFCIQPIT